MEKVITERTIQRFSLQLKCEEKSKNTVEKYLRDVRAFAAALAQSPHLTRLLQRGYEATMGEWYNYTRTTANAAQQAFIRACDKAYNLTASGDIIRRGGKASD